MQTELLQKCLTLRSRTERPHFTLESRTLHPSPTDILIKVLCFSIDPVMKFSLAGAQTYFHKVQMGDIFNCFGLAQVIRGNEEYPVGAYLFGNVGTCDYNVLDELRQRECFVVDEQLVRMYGEAEFLYLINNGLAAFAGYEIMGPKEGDTVVVSTASGATGILLCQLLHKKGAKVLALTSAHKFKVIQKYVTHAVDYKDAKTLVKTLSSTKFSHYFDNVGQHLLDLILEHIQINGKIALCGAIANYNSYSERGIRNCHNIISKRLALTGLTFMAMIPRIEQIFKQYKGIELRIFTIGMEQFQQYFMDLLTSGNDIIGKVVVKM